jgi:heat-inducible transcriptional repressor
MVPIPMLDDRKAEILKALVETHIRTGAPVSSRAILDASGLGVSPATVRNELAQLEREGYAVQPHTSAGRVPTGPAYRYYVDHLSPARLRSAIATKIESFFTRAHAELDHLLQSTSELLAEITHLPSLVVGPASAHEALRGVHLVQLGEREVIVIFVTSSGRVAKEVASFKEAVSSDVVASAEALLNAHVGTTISELPAAVKLSDAARSVAAAASRAAAVVAPARGGEVFRGGTSQLAAVWEDLAKVKRILDLLEHDSRVSALLSEIEAGTVVRIGAELPLDDADVALVAASYVTATGDQGRVSVLGPMRMDYGRTIRVVEEVGESLGESL